MISIFIVDDHQLFREGLVSLFSDVKEIQIVGQAKNGYDLLAQLKHLNPQVILMDIEMENMDGLTATRQLKSLHPEINILALTMHNRSGYIKQMMQSGASGYILKDAGKEELLRAIQTVADGQQYFSEGVMLTVMNNLTKDKDVGSPLSSREMEIVQMIANEYTSTEIADKLHLSKLTVETHRKNILLKLGLRNVAGLIKYAFQKGWIN